MATSRTDNPTSLAGRLTGGNPDGREGRDILRHLASLSLTKAGAGLSDAKLVLAWLLTQLGAASWLIGLLVPVREVAIRRSYSAATGA